MIRVYRITQDGDRYQSFTEREYERYALGSWDCRSRRESWVPPEVEVIDPPILDGLDQGDLAGDFWQGSQDTLVTSPRATEILRPFLEAAGELLPLPFEGVEYTVLNVTRCVDCFDDERAEWRRTEDGRRISLKRYAFFLTGCQPTPVCSRYRRWPSSICWSWKDSGHPKRSSGRSWHATGCAA